MTDDEMLLNLETTMFHDIDMELEITNGDEDMHLINENCDKWTLEEEWISWLRNILEKEWVSWLENMLEEKKNMMTRMEFTKPLCIQCISRCDMTYIHNDLIFCCSTCKFEYENTRKIPDIYNQEINIL